ncbi:MAG: hypothetical protein IK990_08450 [Ruminiclostridium sp.]|nr:hypothetical protein [Ruminiclostridium sp.]
MKKRFLAASLAAALLFCGCSKEIDYSAVTLPPEYTEKIPDPDADKDRLQESVIIPEEFAVDTYSPTSYIIDPLEYDETIQLEFGSDSQTYTSGLTGFNGEGFICLGNYEYATVEFTVPSSQYYDITVRLCSNSTKVSVITGGEKEIQSSDGDYMTLDGTVCGAVYAGTGNEFEPYTLKGVYLGKGENRITLQVISGTAYIDEITLKNGSSVQKLAYEVSNACIDPNAALNTKTVKRYLADVYGNRVLTGQFVSSGTNTEINAIYMSTGRYSAVRCADIGIFSENYQGYDKNDENEISTAINWWKNGGLVSYTWYWQSPLSETPSCFKELTDFDLTKAVTDSEVADLSPASLEAYLQTGRISKECMALINDIDAIAQKLKLLEMQDVPVLFRPMPEAGNGWYWWGCDSESYLWLYRFMFTRFTQYHKLTNIIWVWDGESYDCYPGDDYVDIVGMDIYTNSDISGNNRMMDAIGYTIKSKCTALTECGRIPNPDHIARDGAYWLWFALWKGDYIINSNGSIQYSHVTATELDYAYNNELFITRDELPDFSRY